MGQGRYHHTGATRQQHAKVKFSEKTYSSAAKKTHYINLVTGVDKDNAYTVDLRHNAQGDTIGQYAIFSIAFDLSKLPATSASTPKLKVNYKNLEGKSKSVDIPFYFHKNVK